jgi:gliding motility-associated-like protein
MQIRFKKYFFKDEVGIIPIIGTFLLLVLTFPSMNGARFNPTAEKAEIVDGVLYYSSINPTFHSKYNSFFFILGDPPVANLDTVSVLQGTSVSGNVLLNDSDPDGDVLVLNTTPIIAPMYGTVTLNADGSFTYVPFPYYVGTDQFTYEVCDGNKVDVTNSYDNQTNVIITPFGTPVVSSTITVISGGIVTDVNIPNFYLEHTRDENLIITLTSPSGTEVILVDQVCGDENFDIGFDDESGVDYTNMPCPPDEGGLNQPFESMSGFDGENSTGDWVFTIYDVVFNDGGFLDFWELDITSLGAAAGTNCETATVTALVYSSSTEICSNNIDDDGDGLVDVFDPDCPCDDDNFLGLCDPQCEYFPPGTPSFDITVEWSSKDSVNTFTPVIGADLDGDNSSIEILGFKGSTITYVENALFIIDGSNGLTKYTFNSKPLHIFNKGIAFGDVDRDGNGEIYYMIGNEDEDDYRRIACYEYNPSGTNLGGTGTGSFDLQWVSDQRVTCGLAYPFYTVTDNFAVNLADFNNDGFSEVYVGNEIFDAITGTRLAVGGPNNIGNNIYNFYSHEHFHANTIAVDALPDADCTNCAGLELVAGNQVYSVDLSSGVMTVEKELTSAPGYQDGPVSIADYDLDGDVDGIITTTDVDGSYLYIWDLQTETLIGNVHTITDADISTVWYRSASNATIADFDGDNKPEIGVCANYVFQVIEDYQFDISGTGGVSWSLTTTDRSGMTGATSFDFNADGLTEVVYRDENDLRIISGSTGVNLSTFPCGSRTGGEYPIVLDIDNDNETELVCSCADESFARNGRMRAFKSLNYPWVPTRNIWNQYAYFITNINDDLSIPPVQQPHHLVGSPALGSSGRLNSFLKQVGPYNNEGEPVFPASDIIVKIIDGGSVECGLGDSINVILRFYNFGDLSYPAGIPFSVYEGNPENTGHLIGAFDIPTSIIPGDSVDISIRLAVVGLTAPFNLFVIGNDDGSLPLPLDLENDFPATSIGECDFSNNMDSIFIDDCETEDPVLAGVPSDVTIECDETVSVPLVTATDNCSTEMTVIYSFVENSGSCIGSIIRTWTVTDDCGNVATESQTITVQDSEAPFLWGVPSNTTFDCDSQYPAIPDVTATDDCSGVMTITYDTLLVGVGCPYTVTRTWTATDNCNNSVSQSYTLSVLDDELPVITGVPSNITVECKDVPDPANVTVSDNCDNNINLTYEDIYLPNGSYEDNNEVTVPASGKVWNINVSEFGSLSASDFLSFDLSFQSNKGKGRAEFVLINPSGQGIFLVGDYCTGGDCEATEPTPLTWNTTFTRCDTGSPQWNNDDPIPTGVGNFTPHGKTPIDAVPGVSEYLDCFEDFTGPMDGQWQLYARKNQTANGLLRFLGFSFNLGNHPCLEEGTIFRTWKATDDCGNTEVASQTITLEDTTPPIVNTYIIDTTVTCYSDIPPIPVLTVSDCDDNATIIFQGETGSGDCEFEFIRTWLATDNCGNDTIITQTITVKDTIAPVLDPAPEDITIGCEDNIPTPTDLEATDNCWDEVDIDFSESLNMEVCPFILRRVWIAIDECDNADSVVQIITILDDTPPVLIGIPDDIILDCQDCLQDFENGGFEDNTVTGNWAGVPESQIPGWDTDASDNKIEIQRSGKINGVVSYEGEWHAELNHINNGDLYQTFCVVPTTILQISFAHRHRPAGENWSDDIMGVYIGPDLNNLTLIETIIGRRNEGWKVHNINYSVPANQPEAIFLFRAIQGSPNNISIGNLIDDINIITIPGTTVVPSVSDNCTDDISFELSEVKTENDCPDNYKLVRAWTAMDDCGNITVDSQVIIVGDFIGPEITGVPQDTIVNCDDVPDAVIILTATDNCGGDYPVTFVEETTGSDCPSNYNIVRIWKAEDLCGNITIDTQIISVLDTIEPIIYNLPQDLTVNCEAIPDTVGNNIFASDNCNTTQIFFSESIGDTSQVNCEDNLMYTIKRKWVAVDGCDNRDSVLQNITVYCGECCENEIDDDYDGTIDNFDGDCPCNDILTNIGNDYFNLCQPDCEFNPNPAIPFSIVKSFETESEIHSAFTIPLIGDLDGNGETNIVVINADDNGWLGRGITIYNGKTKNVINTHNFVNAAVGVSGPGQIAIANVDTDPPAELFIYASHKNAVTSSKRRRIIRYDFNSDLSTMTETWVSNQAVTGGGRSGGVIGLADFNGDGVAEVYAENDIFNTQTGVRLINGSVSPSGQTWSNNGHGETGITVAADLTDAPGLELAAGTSVFEFDFVNVNGEIGNSYNEIPLGQNNDGFTSIADMDNDGELDVVVATPGLPGTSELYIWNPRTKTLMAEIDLPMNGSSNGIGRTVGPPFIGDVDGDGFAEIGVFRRNLIIIYDYDGTGTLNEKARNTVFDASARTGLTMFDFNQDGISEVVYRGMTTLHVFNISGNIFQELNSFECLSFTGNEYPIVANIDDDPSAELICNCGMSTNTRKGKMVIFESGGDPWAPSRSVWNQYAYNTTNVNNDLTIPKNPQNNATLFGGANRPLNNFYEQATLYDENGIPIFPASELEVLFEFGNFSLEGVEVCEGADINIEMNINNNGNVPSGDTHISYYIGNPFNSPPNATLLSTVEVPSISQNSTSSFNDTIAIDPTLLPLTLYAVLNDNGSNTLPLSFPLNGQVDCAPGNDTFHLFIPDGGFLVDDLEVICFGDSVVQGDNIYYQSGIYVDTLLSILGCDSIVNMEVIVNPTYIVNLQEEICLGEEFVFGDSTYTDQGNYTNVFQSIFSGCDSTVNLNLTVNYLYNDSIKACVCFGNNYEVGDSSYTTSGIHVTSMLSVNGCDSIVTLDLTVSPEPTLIGVPLDITVNCESIPSAAVVSVSDSCNDTMPVNFTELTGIGCPYTITRTWISVDSCNNIVTGTQLIIVEDTTAPVLSNVPNDVTVDCGSLPSAPIVIATDNCASILTIDYSEVVSAGCPYTITRTWSAIDSCNNTVTESQVITVTDTIAPVLSNVPTDITVDCISIPSAPIVTVTDDCTSMVIIDYSEVVSVGCPYTITRTWSATDSCNNTVTGNQIITVEDITAPVLSNVPSDVTVDCGLVPVVPEVTATDNCASIMTIDYYEVVSVGCPYTITRTWSATDSCNNTVTENQVITVEDNIAPVLVNVPIDVTVDCGSVPVVPEVTAIDDCSSAMIVDYNEVISTDCPYLITRTWSVTDFCNNLATITQIITVEDYNLPILSGVPSDITIECNEILGEALVTAEDDCSGILPVTFTEVLGTGCPNTITRSWTAIDDCDNEVIETQIITLIDTVNPVFANVPSDITVECNAIPDTAEVTVNDNCTSVVDISFSEIIKTGCPYTITRKWVAIDDCQNIDSIIQVIYVDDNTFPILTGVPNDKTVDCESIPNIPIVTSTDLCSGDLPVLFEEEIGTGCPYTITRIWSAIDPCNNMIVDQQTITVEDNTYPFLVNVPSDVTVNCGAIPDTVIVVANDNCTTNIEILFTEDISNGCPFIITRTWTANDSCGNSISKSQIITVNDNELPTLVGVPNNITVNCEAIPDPAVVSAIDGCWDNLTPVLNEVVSSGCPYTITRTWIASDSCGNYVSETQVVTVKDEEGPVFETPPADITLDCDDSIPPAAELTATDNCSGEEIDGEYIIEDIDFSEVISDGCPFKITRTWTAYDECDNESTVTQVITIEDTTLPTLFNLPNDLTLNCGEIPDTQMVVATDNCDPNLEMVFDEVYSDTICDNTFKITRTWTFTDDCENEIFFTQNIQIQDITAPVFASVPVDMMIPCDSVPELITPTATDNCSDVLVVFEEIETPGDCVDLRLLTRTWTATDVCGNESSVSQNIFFNKCSSEATLVIAPDSIVCEGTDISFEVTLTEGYDTPFYQWQFSTNGMTWMDIVGANDSIFTLNTEIIHAGFYQVIVANDTLEINNTLCSITSNTQSLEVKALTVENESFELEICKGDSIVVGGSVYFETGNFIDTLSASSGCDSAIINLDLIVFDTYRFFVDSTICEGEFVTVGGMNYFENGSFEIDFNSIEGCDSLVTLNLTVNPVTQITLDEYLCGGQTFTVGNTTYDTTGVYVNKLLSSLGCDSVVILNLVIDNILEINLVENICPGESFVVGSSIYTQTGVYQDTLVALNGCDSLITLDLTLTEQYNILIQESICSGEELVIGDSTYNSSGIYFNVMQSVNGCDSIITLDLTVSAIYLENIVATICEGATYEIGDSTYMATGVHTTILTSINGCDSIAILDLTVNEVFSEMIVKEICFGQSYQVGGISYTLTGVYTNNLVSVTGCDSIVVLDLTVHDVVKDDIVAEICFGENYVLGDSTYTTRGIYVQSYTTVNGCDSIITLDLTTLEENKNSMVASICQGSNYTIGDSIYTTSGIYTTVLTSSVDCDSTIILDLSVNPNIGTYISVSICEGEDYFVAGGNQTNAGIYLDTLLSIVGCDSIVTTDLNILLNTTTSLQEEICENDFYIFAGVQFTESGIYSDTLITDNGCDSIVVLELNVLSESVDSVQVLICDGFGFEFGNEIYFESGIYDQNFTSSNGCDSLITLTLTVADIIMQDQVATICSYESYEFGNEILTESGLYSDTLISISGCDSIVNLDLTTLFPASENISAVICFGDLYLFGDTSYQSSGIYEQILVASSGCDSLVTLNLSVIPDFQMPISATLCANDYYQVGDSLYNQSGFYSDTLLSITGCDSIIVLNLNVLPIDEELVEAIICAGEIYQIGSNAYNTSGIYSDTLVSINGCDSITNLVLEIMDIQPTVIYQNLCEGDSIILEGTYQTTGGVFTDILQSVFGCDSLVHTYVTLLDNATTYVQEIICNGDSILIVGEYQFEAGEFMEILNSVEGCDSIIITELIVDPSIDIYVEGIELCLGDEGQLFVEGAEVVTWSPTLGLSCDNCPNPMVSPSSTTTYTVRAKGCLGEIVETSVTVYVNIPPDLVVSDVETILLGESVYLMASTDGLQDIVTWSDGTQTICENCREITVTPEETTIYYISAVDEFGCEMMEEITIRVNEACQYSRLQIPNMISPNGDGYNDRFEIRHEGFGQISLLKVFNRWGEVIYETNDIDQPWDGTFKGVELNPGVYVYFLEGFCLNDETFIKTGNVTIIK